MSKLEDIVPPLELCKQIPAGEFEKSVLVWKRHKIFFRGTDIMDQTDRVTFRADEQNDIVSTYRSTRYYPAPTLAEILAELPEGVQMRMRTARNGERQFQIYHYSYETWTKLPAAAALWMWLRIRRQYMPERGERQ